MNIDPVLLQWLIPVATAAAAWGGSRQALNGTRERVRLIDSKLDGHVAKTSGSFINVTERLAVVETKVDGLKGRGDHHGI